MRRAFTLIELLIVILIIGILSTLAVPALNILEQKRAVPEALVAINRIIDAERMYHLRNGNYYNLNINNNNNAWDLLGLRDVLDDPNRRWKYDVVTGQHYRMADGDDCRDFEYIVAYPDFSSSLKGIVYWFSPGPTNSARGYEQGTIMYFYEWPEPSIYIG
jgi:prepilin-type N-terminal cleavage/methylation domain-containing protein